MEKELVRKLEAEKKKLREKREKVRQRKIQQRVNEEHEKEVGKQLELVKAKAQKETDILKSKRFEKQRLEAERLRSLVNAEREAEMHKRDLVWQK